MIQPADIDSNTEANGRPYEHGNMYFVAKKRKQ